MVKISLPQDAHPDRAIIWQENKLYLLDQRLLPHKETYIELRTAVEAARAIQQMVVRGAPAIGITAAYAMVLSLINNDQQWEDDRAILEASRPTAINLFWATKRMGELRDMHAGHLTVGHALDEAKAIHLEDIAANKHIGELGAQLIENPTSVITHCNAGALATGGYGTALGVIRSAYDLGKIKRVYVDETRPWQQGTRLTAWELAHFNIPVSVMADVAATARMQAGGIDWIIVGSDRIASNGDVANKIGTFQLAIAAKHLGVKFMVAATVSTIDFELVDGAKIPIEYREGTEVLNCGKKQIGVDGLDAWNPVFDVTPAALVDVIVTERGVIHNPTTEKIQQLR